MAVSLRLHSRRFANRPVWDLRGCTETLGFSGSFSLVFGRGRPSCRLPKVETSSPFVCRWAPRGNPVRFENPASGAFRETARFSKASFRGFEVLSCRLAFSCGFSLQGVCRNLLDINFLVSTFGNSVFSLSERRNPCVFGVAEEFRGA